MLNFEIYLGRDAGTVMCGAYVNLCAQWTIVAMSSIKAIEIT